MSGVFFFFMVQTQNQDLLHANQLIHTLAFLSFTLLGYPKIKSDIQILPGLNHREDTAASLLIE